MVLTVWRRRHNCQNVLFSVKISSHSTRLKPVRQAFLIKKFHSPWICNISKGFRRPLTEINQAKPTVAIPFDTKRKFFNHFN